MAGIVGIVSQKAKEQREIVEQMLNIIKHRGQRYKNIFMDKNIIIGFQSDINTIGEYNNIYLFMDGIIYNRNELTRFISEECNSSLSDEDILLRLYNQYGVEGFKFVNGDFAIVIWDSLKESLILLKYIINHKNIYYYKKEDVLVFASEIKSLFKYYDIEKKLDNEALNDFLTFKHIPAPYTPFKNIRRLEPSTGLICYKNGLIKKIRLEFFKIYGNVLKLDEIEICRCLYNNLDEAILKRIKKVKTYGLFLSGGTDSSTILYFLNKYSTEPIRTYNIALQEDGPYADMISKFFSTNHKSFCLNATNLLEIVPKALWYSERPFAGCDAFQYYLTAISQNEKFVFWGQAAEEILFGRNHYIVLFMKEKFKKTLPLDLLAKHIKSLMAYIGHKSVFHKLFKILFSLDPFDSYIFFRELFRYKERKKLLKEIPEDFPINRLIGNDNLGDDLLKNYSYLTLMNGYVNDVWPGGGQELMNPYLDKDFVNFAYSIPSYLKCKNFQRRYLINKLMHNKIPNSVLRRNTDNWRVPNWIKKKKEIFYGYINKLLERMGIRYDVKDFLKIRGDCSFDLKFWALFSLELMCEIFLDKTDIEEPPLLKDFT